MRALSKLASFSLLSMTLRTSSPLALLPSGIAFRTFSLLDISVGLLGAERTSPCKTSAKEGGRNWRPSSSKSCCRSALLVLPSSSAFLSQLDAPGIISLANSNSTELAVLTSGAKEISVTLGLLGPKDSPVSTSSPVSLLFILRPGDRNWRTANPSLLLLSTENEPSTSSGVTPV